MGFLRILEITSLIMTVIGLYFIGEKDPLGPLFHMVSLICQMIIFYKNKNWFLIFQMIILIGFNIYIYFKWIGGI